MSPKLHSLLYSLDLRREVISLEETELEVCSIFLSIFQIIDVLYLTKWTSGHATFQANLFMAKRLRTRTSN
jgi:hypothetical protein